MAVIYTVDREYGESNIIFDSHSEAMEHETSTGEVVVFNQEATDKYNNQLFQLLTSDCQMELFRQA